MPCIFFVGRQEYSSRTLGATWGIISAVILPIVILLICVGWRIFKRKKEEEKEENDYLNVKTRSIDPDESFKVNSDDDSIPYKKDDTIEDSPEPTEPVKLVETENLQPSYSYQPYQEQPKQDQGRQWTGETEIN
ncbi:unnamed protein product [Parnassius apollo]|uniref:(apollo) hypothetical protein n=1 Tax=Parnassius apollo TaxID=110799 RepID=A0A8S3W311_PARAO|nr:unnamed protein product [Parnassius apollo]